MPNSVSLFYWNERLQMSQPRTTELLFTITGAKTVTDSFRSPTYTSFDAITPQSVIDNFLGTTNEFLIAAFDATAMGTDAFAMIVNMKGQMAELYSMRYVSLSGTTGVTQAGQFVEDSSALTASTLATEAAMGANNNVAFRVVSSGLDSITSGSILVSFMWRSK